MSFSKKYSEIFDIVREDIKKVEDNLVEDINLSPFVNETLQNFLMRKPKRIRPLLAFLYLRALGIEPDEKQYTFQSAIEIIHNASLIHDDVVDEAEIRRGEDSINKKFNNKTAILTGDYLLSIALRKLNEVNSPETISLCADTLAEMCQGEVQQYFNKFKITTIEDYLKKTEQKTAKLFQTAVIGGLILTGKTELDDAKNFSHAFGMAFQIRDDILNITEAESLKPSQNDIENGIYNAPVIFTGKTSDLSVGIEKTKSLLNNYVNEAGKALKNLEDSRFKIALKELLDILNNA